jgi:hypothetical protein
MRTKPRQPGSIVEIMQSLPEPHIECGCRLFLGPAVARFDARAFGPCQRRTRDTKIQRGTVPFHGQRGSSPSPDTFDGDARFALVCVG